MFLKLLLYEANKHNTEFILAHLTCCNILLLN